MNFEQAGDTLRVQAKTWRELLGSKHVDSALPDSIDSLSASDLATQALQNIENVIDGSKKLLKGKQPKQEVKIYLWNGRVDTSEKLDHNKLVYQLAEQSGELADICDRVDAEKAHPDLAELVTTLTEDNLQRLGVISSGYEQLAK